MKIINKSQVIEFLYTYFPAILLFASVLNEFDFNYLGLKYFSFNFSYILIFYFSLKKPRSLGYGLIFISGLFNDVVTDTPIGGTSLSFLLICGFAAYLKNITLRPNLIKDWIFFLMTISVVKSISYIFLTLFFSFQTNYFEALINITFTFVLYLFFCYLFSLFERIIIGRSDA